MPRVVTTKQVLPALIQSRVRTTTIDSLYYIADTVWVTGNMTPGSSNLALQTNQDKMLSYRRETALQGAL